MSARELILSCFLSVFQPRSDKTLGEWMAAHVTIRPQENPNKPGSYDPDYTPLTAKLIHEFETSSEWNELIVEKSSQAAFSFHSLGLITRRVAEDPGNIMYVIDSDKEAKNISQRLQFLLEDCSITSQIYAEADELAGISTLRMQFPGMNLWLTGAGSAGSLANKTATLGIADEVDKHKDLNGEAMTIDLLRSRLKEQPGSKLIAYSTPTTVNGQIHREAITGSRHVAFVPCPHCNHYQELVLDRVKFGHCKDLAGEWDLQRVLVETYYECAGCQGKILDRHKRWMVHPSRARWQPTNFKTVKQPDGTEIKVPAWFPGRMSAHYSDLYSQNENVSFGRLALKFITALKDPMKMRDFLQNNMGKPDQESVAEVTEDKLLALRGAYKRQRPQQIHLTAPLENDDAQQADLGTPIPEKPLFAAVLSDTQDDRSEWMILAFTRRGDIYVIDWGSCLELEDLDEVRSRSVRWAIRRDDGTTEEGETPVSVTMIDEGGHRSFEVRQYAYARFPEVFTSRGSVGSGGSLVALRDYRIRKEDESSPTMPVVVYNDDIFKQELYIRCIARFDPVKAAAYDQARIWLPSNLETQLIAGLSKEKKERQRDGSWKWNSPKGNELGDTLKMGKILFSYIGNDLVRAEASETASGAA